MVAGGGFHSFLTSNVLNKIKEEKLYVYEKDLKHLQKIGSILIWVQFQAYPKTGALSKFRSIGSNKQRGIVPIQEKCPNLGEESRFMRSVSI